MEVLYHHGIRGQRWGKRNGPPYPLNPEDYSAEEKKQKFQLSSSQKKAIAIGAAAAATVLAGYGLYKAGAFEKLYGSAGEMILDSEPLRDTSELKREIENHIKVINPDGERNNCMFCTLAYELRRRGMDVVANARANPGSFFDLNLWFDDAKIDALTKTSVNEIISKIESMGEGARGNIGVTRINGANHSMAFEVIDGKAVILDCQKGFIIEGEHLNRLKEYIKLDNVLICRTDNLTLTDDAEFIDMAVHKR